MNLKSLAGVRTGTVLLATAVVGGLVLWSVGVPMITVVGLDRTDFGASGSVVSCELRIAWEVIGPLMGLVFLGTACLVYGWGQRRGANRG